MSILKRALLVCVLPFVLAACEGGGIKGQEQILTSIQNANSEAIFLFRDTGFQGSATLMPVFLKNVLVGQLGWATDLAAHIEFMIIGGLIVVFLIVEPHGLAQLWRVAKEKLRLWPFPH